MTTVDPDITWSPVNNSGVRHSSMPTGSAEARKQQWSEACPGVCRTSREKPSIDESFTVS